VIATLDRRHFGVVRPSHYAHTREECLEAYQRARRRADAIVAQLGPSAVVNDGGIDRGSGTCWDLYMGQ
jgi:hypothetical protein